MRQYFKRIGSVDSQRRLSVSSQVAIFALVFLGCQSSPALARPGNGFGDLIDNYCIERGRLRVRAHQPHCAMCHHLGTFDTSPEHRIEPNWNEFLRGRTTGDFSFFCPGGADTSQTARAPGEKLPSGPKSTTAETAESSTSPMGMPPGANQPSAPVPEGRQASVPPSERQTNTAAPPALSDDELAGKMAALHDAVGITTAQEPAWLDLLDAAARALQRPSGPAEAATKDPVTLLKVHEVQSSKHVASMRAVGLALARLNASLSDQQRQRLVEGLRPILAAMPP